MHFAIITHTVTPGDGQGRVNYEVARSALQRGHRVTLVASHVDPVLAREPMVTWVPVEVNRWPTAFVRNLVFAWRTTRWLRRNAAQIDATLANGAITWPATDVNAVHFVHTAWLESPVHTARREKGLYAAYQWLYTAFNGLWERRAFRKARHVVAVSDRVGVELAEAGIPTEKISLIPNGVELTEFHPGNADRDPLNLPSDVPLILFVGDLQTPRKNLDTVLHALTQLPDVHLAVVGNLKRSPYPELAEKLHLTDRVHFLGFRRDVATLMRAADVCACPSRYEPFSLVLLEALASGRPVVTSEAVGASTLLTDACGIVVPDAEDSSALAQALHHMIVRSRQDPELPAAARTVAEQYSWDRTAAAYVDLLERAARPLPRTLSLPPQTTPLPA